MPLNHDEAAATVTVTGVSLGCVNPDAKRWEVGFLRHPEHTLVMEVFKRTAGREEPFRPRTEIPLGSSITVEVAGAAARDPKIFAPENAPNDPEHFSLILDIEKDVYDGVRIPFKERPEHELTPLFVPGAILHAVADKLVEFPVRMIRKGDPNLVRIKRFDEVGTTAGADILPADDGRGEVLISVEGPGGFNLRLPHAEGSNYLIVFDNTCPGDAQNTRPARRDGTVKTSLAGEPVREHSDFVLYYTVLDPGARGLFDLVDDEPGRGDGAVCNNSHLGITTRMFPPP